MFGLHSDGGTAHVTERGAGQVRPWSRPEARPSCASAVPRCGRRGSLPRGGGHMLLGRCSGGAEAAPASSPVRRGAPLLGRRHACERAQPPLAACRLQPAACTPPPLVQLAAGRPGATRCFACAQECSVPLNARPGAASCFSKSGVCELAGTAHVNFSGLRNSLWGGTALHNVCVFGFSS